MRGELQASEASEVSEPQRAGRREHWWYACRSSAAADTGERSEPSRSQASAVSCEARR